MKEFRFPVSASLGNMHYCEAWLDTTLTDREAKKLIKYGTQAKYYFKSLAECFWLKGLHKKLYKDALEVLTEEGRENKFIDEKYRNDPNWRIDDTYECIIDFPEEFEDDLEYDE